MIDPDLALLRFFVARFDDDKSRFGGYRLYAMARLRKSQKRWIRSSTESDLARVLIKCEPPVFALDPGRVFDRDAPLEIEIGAGKGDFILSRAAAHPNRNLLAVELSSAVVRLLALRVAHSDSNNVRVLQADARSIVNLLLPDRSVSAYHIYFPDPWPKDRHAKHRLFSPFFVANLARTLRPGGLLYVATDVRDYADRIFTMLDSQGFICRSESASGDLNSNFGKKFAAEGRPLSSASFVAPDRIGESRVPSSFPGPIR
jgi:tRNA (guanine-N7-)-methyltransferase